MKAHTTTTALVLVAMLVAVNAYPASVGLAHVKARPNGVAQIPVEISAATDLAGVNLRLEYDPGVFSSPVLLRDGSLLGSSHILTSHSPEPGKLNIVSYAAPGSSPFAARSGRAFSIILRVAPSVQAGTYPITFTTTGPSLLASSGLSDEDGKSIPHATLAASVVVGAAPTCDLNSDDQVTREDLMLLIEDWHQVSPVPLLPADINGDTVVDEKDAMIFVSDWMRSY